MDKPDVAAWPRERPRPRRPQARIHAAAEPAKTATSVNPAQNFQTGSDRSNPRPASRQRPRLVSREYLAGQRNSSSPRIRRKNA